MGHCMQIIIRAHRLEVQMTNEYTNNRSETKNKTRSAKRAQIHNRQMFISLIVMSTEILISIIIVYHSYNDEKMYVISLTLQCSYQRESSAEELNIITHSIARCLPLK